MKRIFSCVALLVMLAAGTPAQTEDPLKGVKNPEVVLLSKDTVPLSKKEGYSALPVRMALQGIDDIIVTPPGTTLVPLPMAKDENGKPTFGPPPRFPERDFLLIQVFDVTTKEGHRIAVKLLAPEEGLQKLLLEKKATYASREGAISSVGGAVSATRTGWCKGQTWNLEDGKVSYFMMFIVSGDPKTYCIDK